MSLRERTKKRLRWFSIALVIAGLLAAGGYALRERQLERRAVAGREEGLRLLEGGDYFNAMHKIGPFVRRHPEDVDALFAYARARQQVPEPNGKHISEALALFRRVLNLSPRNVPAAEALLRLYQDHGLATEALQLSKDLLALDPKNRRALEGRAAALYALGRFAKDEAFDAAIDYSKANPTEIEGQLLVLEILRRRENPREGVLKRCEELRKAHPNDTTFLLLTGMAHLSLNEVPAAKQWIEQACQGEMSSVTSLRLLAEYCDRLQMFGQALAVLQRHGKKGGEFAALLVGRLWEQERYKELVEQVDGKLAADAHCAALRCLAQHRLGQKDQAVKGLDRLKEGSATNPLARTWWTVARALTEPARPDDAALIAACQQALKENRHPHLQFILAEAYLRTGEADSAVELWQQVTRSAPGWAAPLAHLGQAALLAGQYEDAARLARAALDRSPDDSKSMLLLAQAKATGSLTVDAATATEVLALLDRAEASDSNRGVAPLRVHVLASAGRKDEAIAAARRALEPSAKTSAAALLQLATVSQSLRLGLEEQCLQRCEQLHGWTADLALLRARHEFDAGRKAEALDLFSKARAASPSATAEKGTWDAAWARLLEMSGDPRAKQAWVALADGSPEDSLVQWLAMSARSVQGDREFIGRALDRLRGRIGDQGLTWRLSRARWLLSGEGSQNAVEAALILNDLTRSAPNMLAPRLLLADCLARLGNISGAIDQLTAAANLQPQSSPIALQLARLLQSRNELPRARVHLDRVMKNPASTLAHAREAAGMIAAQGDPVAALDGLKRAYGAAINEPPRDLLLANLYRGTNQPQLAEAIVNRMLQEPDAAAVAFAADFYVSQGRPADADAVLKRLDTLKAEPGIREIILGTHAMRSGNPALAIEQFKAATRLGPANPVGWRQLIRTQLGTGDIAGALAAGEAAQKNIPSDGGLAAFARRAPAAEDLKKQWPEYARLMGDLLEAPDEEQTIAAVAEVLAKPAALASGGSALNKLTSLASAHPRMLPLQVIAAKACLQAGRAEDASAIATRCVRTFPDGVAATGFAAVTLASAGRWEGVLEMAKHWRQRAGTDTLAVDQMAAAAHVHLGDLAAAHVLLSPHAERMKADPERYRSVIAQYARLQALRGDADEAIALVRPQIGTSPEWRLDWMKLAVSGIKDVARSAAMLEEVATKIPVERGFDEALALSVAWRDLFARSNAPEHRAAWQGLVERLTKQAGEQGSAAGFLALGMMHEANGAAAQAEKCYRDALARQPGLQVAQNNLAMILSSREERLDEALALAKQAVGTAHPALANFYDTLAAIQARRLDYAAAADASREAVRLDRNNVAFQVRLAQSLVGAGNAGQAKAVIRQIEALPLDEASQDVRSRLDMLRERLR
ncbi:MAG TPA: tetratricopeptide repeat protein [Tepidisphaeraceae bacterium]|nr:tetratricopeptide repeat protein [Tepidisphaeraceae bacterium]